MSTDVSMLLAADRLPPPSLAPAWRGDKRLPLVPPEVPTPGLRASGEAGLEEMGSAVGESLGK